MDTSYNRVEWSELWTGPQQNAPHGQYWFDYTHITQPSLMDTVDNCMAGPIYMQLGNHWNFYGTNYDSVYFSSNGFIGFRPYSEAVAGSPPMYQNGNAANLLSPSASLPHAIVAAFWADLDIRHGGPADTSKVYYRTSPSVDTFFVNYYNFRLHPGGSNQAPPEGWTAPGANKLFIKKFQIVLASTDSSIQINYGGFTGSINGFPPTLAYLQFENNVSIGLTNETGSQTTSVLDGKASARWDAVNTTCRICNKAWTQQKQWAYKFKRWHDVVTAVSVLYPPRNYEICLGTSVTPVASFKNVDAVSHSFEARFQIRNAVTAVAVYSRDKANLNIAPGATVTDTFQAYATNPNILSQLGTFNACAISSGYDTSGNSIGDQWPYDDTVCTTVFGVRRITVPFEDFSNNYSKTASADIPDQTLWISVGAQVVDGEGQTFDPPPPRVPSGDGPDNFTSPVILMDRADINGNTYAGSNVGDTLTSFPINLQGKTKANLTFDFQRGGNISGGYSWLYDFNTMQGPEATVLNSQNLTVYRPGDSMILEFKDPGQPGCNPAANSWHYITGIDGGHDFEFQKFFMSLTQNSATVNLDGIGISQLTILNYFTADFRFRFRLKAKYDAASIPPPNDDLDPWYLDNPTVLVPLKPDIEVMWVRVVNPYTKVPASQAVSLPVYVKIANLSTAVSIAFPIRVEILDPNENTVYWQTVTVNTLQGGTDSVLQMPNWNAQNTTAGGGAEYIVNAWLDEPGYQADQSIIGTYTNFYLNVEQGPAAIQEFAYDDGGLTPGNGEGNAWPGITNITGQGMGFNGNSGSFAMKFTLATKDTFYGARVYFGSANQSPDYIRLSVLSGAPGACVPGDTLLQEGTQATLEAQRGGDYFDQYWPYYFPTPIILPGGSESNSKGIYWLSCSQLATTTTMMGADVSRGGGTIREWDPLEITPHIEPIYDDPYGTQWSTGSNNGNVSCVWALEVTPGSGSWGPWTPNIGWWPTNDVGSSSSPLTTTNTSGVPLSWFTLPNAGYFIDGGSWTPMLRPIVSQSVLLPVQLVYLKGEPLDGAGSLTWATASERDNSGFEVQRKSVAVQDGMFGNIGFVGANETNSSTETGYSYLDRNVTPGTYAYRLVQTDINGAQHISNEVQITIDAPNNFSLNQNYPNPFTPGVGTTTLSFAVPVAAPATLIIYNQLGEVVNTLVDGNVDVGTHTIRWDGKDQGGSEVASGSYICKLVSGENSATIKMTVSK
jgi:hypothetical protein